MFKNYLKIAFRNLVRNKVYSFINIGGLAVGLACCLAIGLFAEDELNYDKFHTKGRDIFRIVARQNMSGEEYHIATTPGPLAPALKADFGEIMETCRIRRLGNRMYKIDEKVVESNESYATDNSFFSMFDFKLIVGNQKMVLLNPDEVIITESIVEKIWGRNWRNKDDLIGQIISFNDDRVLKLVGIAENCPKNSHIQFEVLMSIKYQETQYQSYKWDNTDYHTYIHLNPSSKSSDLESKLINYYQKYVPISKTQFYLQPFYDIYLKSDFAFDSEWSKISKIIYVKIFSLVGLIILLIAIFNFINLSTARAIKRAKEVGVRKVIGAVRTQLLVQFLSESILVTLLAVIFALCLLTLFLPLLNSIASKFIIIPFTNPIFLIIISSLGLVVGLLAGIFPALYLSNFQSIKALKGVFASNTGQVLRHSLVVIQFSLSVILIIGTIIIYNQLLFLQNKNLGFDKSQLISVRMRYSLRENPAPMKVDLQKEKSIISVASSSNNLIDVNNGTHTIKWEGQKQDDSFLMGLANVDTDYLQTTGMKLLAGRNFDSKISTDTSSAYIINESAAKRMGWTPEQAINKNFTLWETSGKIIGVVQDFHFHKLTTKIEPFLLMSWTKESFNSLMVKTQPNQTKEAIAAIERIYKKYEKQTSFNYEFVDEALENQYKGELQTGEIVFYFSILAIFISCLGLFGLTTFTAETRTKEIGIRKVLGASILQITTLLSKDFLKLVMIAFVIASPIAYYFMDKWLADFAYRITISWWIFALAGISAVLIALITVSWQSIKAAVANPVKSLRSE